MDKETLIKILNTMDIPDMRKDLNQVNIRWLNRNILIRNSEHPEIERAIKIIRGLLKQR